MAFPFGDECIWLDLFTVGDTYVTCGRVLNKWYFDSTTFSRQRPKPRLSSFHFHCNFFPYPPILSGKVQKVFTSEKSTITINESEYFNGIFMFGCYLVLFKNIHIQGVLFPSLSCKSRLFEKSQGRLN